MFKLLFMSLILFMAVTGSITVLSLLLAVAYKKLTKCTWKKALKYVGMY